MRLNSEKSVLLISSEADLRLLSQQVMIKAGYTLYQSDNVQQSREILDGVMVDLCLIDFDFWDSYQSASSRQAGQIETVPLIIMMVPLNHIGYALKELHRGIDHLIVKPFSGDMLLEVVAQTFQMSRDWRLAIQVERMAVVNRLTAAIAHEINNPLQSIQNCIHMIQHGKLSDQALANYIEMVMEEIDRLSKAVKRMLDFHRPGDLSFHPENINDLVSHALVECESRFPHNNIRIAPDLAPGLPRVIVVRHQVEQAILNILVNAFESMPEGGYLSVKTRLLENHVIIDVQDTGPGISATLVQKIFEPFTSTKENRFGLSLAISHGMITAHGGSIDLIQKKGKGALFRISLPVEKIE